MLERQNRKNKQCMVPEGLKTGTATVNFIMEVHKETENYYMVFFSLLIW